MGQGIQGEEGGREGGEELNDRNGITKIRKQHLEEKRTQKKDYMKEIISK